MDALLVQSIASLPTPLAALVAIGLAGQLPVAALASGLQDCLVSPARPPPAPAAGH